MKTRWFRMRFAHPVEGQIVRHMLQYDSLALVDWLLNEEGRFLEITMVTTYLPNNEPTMARWASFAVGARLIEKGEY